MIESPLNYKKNGCWILTVVIENGNFLREFLMERIEIHRSTSRFQRVPNY